ncbi:unnamed protein product [Vicia faba]|uniref:Uncharacterized protein n=1 Tax=Vicia faba TaxID=3906 RepID=A0AAV0YR47_VICFA|nr:unnamed protein product [Vicia faba]
MLAETLHYPVDNYKQQSILSLYSLSFSLFLVYPFLSPCSLFQPNPKSSLPYLRPSPPPCFHGPASPNFSSGFEEIPVEIRALGFEEEESCKFIPTLDKDNFVRQGVTFLPLELCLDCIRRYKEHDLKHFSSFGCWIICLDVKQEVQFNIKHHNSSPY